jgi:hypothetical protein
VLEPGRQRPLLVCLATVEDATDLDAAAGEREQGVVDPRGAIEGEDRKPDLAALQLGLQPVCAHRQELLHQLELGRVVGGEGDLDGDAVDADRLRHISEQAAAELPEREPRKLVRVLPADECTVEDVDVVEVVVGVVVGQVGGASQERRLRLRLAAVVADDELLMEDLRIEVALP